MKVDYEKVGKINEGLDRCNKRREEINERIRKLPLSYGDEMIEMSNKMALEGYDQELSQLDKQYQYLLKERDKCFKEERKTAIRTGKTVRLKDTRDNRIYRCVAYRISKRNYCYLYADEHHRAIAFYQYEIDKGDFELL